TLAVIFDVQALDVVVGRHGADADLVGWDVIGRANNLGGPLQLLDKLAVMSRNGQRLVFQPIAYDRYLAGLLSGEVGFPIFLEPRRRVVAGCTGSRQDAARLGLVANEVGRIVLDA